MMSMKFFRKICFVATLLLFALHLISVDTRPQSDFGSKAFFVWHTFKQLQSIHFLFPCPFTFIFIESSCVFPIYCAKVYLTFTPLPFRTSPLISSVLHKYKMRKAHNSKLKTQNSKLPTATIQNSKLKIQNS